MAAVRAFVQATLPVSFTRLAWLLALGSGLARYPGLTLVCSLIETCECTIGHGATLGAALTGMLAGGACCFAYGLIVHANCSLCWIKCQQIGYLQDEDLLDVLC